MGYPDAPPWGYVPDVDVASSKPSARRTATRFTDVVESVMVAPTATL